MESKAKTLENALVAQGEATRWNIGIILKQYKIDQGAHHGGELVPLVGPVGDWWSLLFQFCLEELQTEILTILLNEWHAGNADVMERYILLNSLGPLATWFTFSCVCIPNGLFIESDYTDALDHAKQALACSRGLPLPVPVKAHLLEMHAVWQMWLLASGSRGTIPASLKLVGLLAPLPSYL